MEFIEMNKEEFRAKLYQTYIASGIQDHVLIQEYIKIAESFIFNRQQYTIDNQKFLQEKLLVESTTYPNHIAELVEKNKADARIALKVIQQFRFGTIDELVKQLELTGYGDVNTTGSLSK